MPLFRDNILQTAGYVPGEQPTDTTTIKLNTNENPYPPSPRVMDAIRAVTAEQLRRYPSPSGQKFREAAAKVHGLTPDYILPFNGGDELLSVAIRAAAGHEAFLRHQRHAAVGPAGGHRKDAREDPVDRQPQRAFGPPRPARAACGNCRGVQGIAGD